MTDEVKQAFKDAGYPVIEDFIQGSFATDTGIKRKGTDFDIDRAIVIDAGKAPDNPVTPKVKLCDDVLVPRGFQEAKVKRPCVTANYKGLNLHIDFPVYRKNGSAYELAVGKRNSDEQHKKWEAADPKGLIDWINDKSSYGASAGDKLAQYKRIVRYLKRWRDEKFSGGVGKKVYSIGLTIMAKESFRPFLDNDGAPNDLIAMRDTVAAMLDRGYCSQVSQDQYTLRVDLPVAPYRDVFTNSAMDTTTQIRNKLEHLKKKLTEAAAESDLVRQCQLLNGQFGDDFEIPKGTSNAKKAVFPTAGAVGTSQGA
uniref:Cyclic GMP-AMP synthase n=1 Tax=Candidatus Kentrum eta TaxID=2126337 RepID=A0A450V1Z2_9GAMM|nr:MAG: hypothetical protein BECKH772B_GA0070898_101445 [Candidatus Kentron sp. H]VFJ98962.1 MAG: hypothetical protein BECKH772A_GA0070896_101504 [Candidatus Kentron sp. H]VFK04076.1 MAG: hypothetical protein BECKH772C_GA0070978_101603 [Candidatus Kentron sp. H]